MDDGPVRGAHRPCVPPVRLPRGARRRAGRGGDGLGRRRRRGDRRRARRRRREGRRRERPALPPVLGTGIRRGAPAHRAGDRRARPDEGARGPRRAAVRGCRHRTLRAGLDRRPPRDAEGDRRTLRPLLEGVRSADGQGRLRRAREGSAEEPLHGRHRRRRLAHLARGRPLLHDGARRRRAGRVLRARRRRDGEREQELGEDHRGGYRPLRAGVLRLRLEEVGFDDHLPPAVRAAPDPLDVPDRLGPGQLRRLPPVRLPRAPRRPRGCGAGRDVPVEQPVRAGDRVGAFAGRDPADDPRERAPVLRRRRPEGRDGGGTRLAGQHDPADVLLRPCGRPRPDRGRGSDQGRDREELRQARALRRGAELRGRRRRARRHARGSRAVRRGRRSAPAAAGPRRCPRLRPARDRDDARGQGRPAPGLGAARRWDLPDRHGEVGEALDRAGDPDLGPGHLHRLRQVRVWSVRIRRSA